MVQRPARSAPACRAEDAARGVEEPWRAVDWDRPLQGLQGGDQGSQDPKEQTQGQ